jgi:CO/xanthine dehydrogenase FAD-binding subunit
MSTVEFFSPDSLVDALEQLDKYQSKAVIVNGGTDVVEKIANGSIDPAAIVYIQAIPELKAITAEGGFVCIGGAATYNDLLASPLCSRFSALLQAVLEIGSPPIRVVGTPAGNVGTAVPAADCNVALMALGAEFVLASKYGQRIVKARDMFVGYCRTQLQPNELIKEIRLPVLPSDTASAFAKLAKRKAQDIAQVSAGVCLSVEGEICKEIVVALGAVNTTTIRAYSLEKILVGKKVEVGAAAVKSLVPVEVALRSPRNKPYKEAVIGVVVERAILKAYAELSGGRK